MEPQARYVISPIETARGSFNRSLTAPCGHQPNLRRSGFFPRTLSPRDKDVSRPS